MVESFYMPVNKEETDTVYVCSHCGDSFTLGYFVIPTKSGDQTGFANAGNGGDFCSIECMGEHMTQCR